MNYRKRRNYPKSARIIIRKVTVKEAEIANGYTPSTTAEGEPPHSWKTSPNSSDCTD